MGNIVVVGLCHLRTFFGTYEQFISVLWNEFFVLTMFVSLYGTGPRVVYNTALIQQFTFAITFITISLKSDGDKGL